MRMLGSRSRSATTAPAAHGRPTEQNGKNGKDDGPDVRSLASGPGLVQELRDGEETNRVEHKEGTQRR
jgi:hypothetical protein